jgi:hypothetical protein
VTKESDVAQSYSQGYQKVLDEHQRAKLYRRQQEAAMRAHQQAYPNPYPPEYSNVTVEWKGDLSALTININASPSITDHLLKQMRETGWLHLRNEAESVCIPADTVESMRITKLTTDE